MSIQTPRLERVLSELLHEKKVSSQLDFAIQLDISESYMSQVMNGKRDLTERLIQKVKAKFGINAAFLRGESEEIYLEDDLPALLDVKLSTTKEIIPLGKHAYSKLNPIDYHKAYEDWEGLPMYNVPISASFVEAYKDEAVYKPQYYLHDPRFRDCDFGAIITGDSMHSEIRHGDFVACKQITDPSFIVYGDIYYVVASNGLETCKYVARVKSYRNGAIQRNGRFDESDIIYDDSQILLVPYNKSIDPSPLPKKMILSIYKVRGIIRGY